MKTKKRKFEGLIQPGMKFQDRDGFRVVTVLSAHRNGWTVLGEQSNRRSVVRDDNLRTRFKALL